MHKTKVIIVGGGLSGLSAAYKLSGEIDFDIHLIEKSARLGGRVNSCSINGFTIDTGGFLVYPWYHHYRELVKVLGLGDELVKVPGVPDYYDSKHDAYDKYAKGIKLAFKDVMEIFIDVFPYELIDTDPTAPRLDAYKHLTIQDYLQSMPIRKERIDFYLNVFDTYLQGYCYGPVSKHKMAFMAATLFQNIRHGDVHSASYLRNGCQIFIDALQAELERKGVQFHLNCSLESVTGRQLITSLGVMSADDFIFCQTPADVPYTRFITATICYSGTAQIDGDSNWGSCFYKEDTLQQYSILSIVNLEKLYTANLAGYLNLNIKVRQTEQPLVNEAGLLSIIRTELFRYFKDISVLSLVNRVDWAGAMPIANEDYVKLKRTEQGLNHLYHGGDFMGCPAMETALMNGKRAAEQLIKVKRQE